MLKPSRAGPICWTCGLVGVHGSVDECLIALRKACAEALQRTIPRAG